MSARVCSPLTRLDQVLLKLGQRLVPARQREDWLRSWRGELWFRHNHALRRSQGRSLTLGLVRDALWLRADSWRTALAGTALLCLLVLAALAGVAALPAILFAGNWHNFAHLLGSELARFALASTLIVMVSYAKAAGNVHCAGYGSVLRSLRAHAFFALRIALLLLLTFLTSTDLTLPLQEHRLFVAMPLQLLLFVSLALLGLRWNFQDGERRCKHCLRSLAGPARVGRPSWNFLEYNGTEQVCRDGHGLLSVPELETSWCRSSAWVPQTIP